MGNMAALTGPKTSKRAKRRHFETVWMLGVNLAEGCLHWDSIFCERFYSQDIVESV